MIAQPTDDLLARAGAFDLFAQASSLPQDRAQFSAELEAQARAVAGAYARLFATDDGKLVLEHLLDVTLRRATWTAALGLTPDQAYGHGVLREGQNSLAFFILSLIARGREEAPPPRGKTEGMV